MKYCILRAFTYFTTYNPGKNKNYYCATNNFLK